MLRRLAIEIRLVFPTEHPVHLVHDPLLLPRVTSSCALVRAEAEPEVVPRVVDAGTLQAEMTGDGVNSAPSGSDRRASVTSSISTRGEIQYGSSQERRFAICVHEQGEPPVVVRFVPGSRKDRGAEGRARGRRRWLLGLRIAVPSLKTGCHPPRGRRGLNSTPRRSHGLEGKIHGGTMHVGSRNHG